ncbi:DUF6297 family protein [Sanguibacter suaedae]|uniref:Uncharacterized protein n=1 Tax=Sanguibacter suaedae TaxID=2795737 RepID=A0A934I796_9MICO|nr:DUF6297 family protein [Sanguibacter suaedae]MBI9115531.1 hypothetical protein [Sanguibacter suaedae]
MTGAVDVRSLRRELRAGAAGPRRTVGEILTDVTYAAVCVALAAVLLLGVAGAVRDALLTAATEGQPFASGLVRTVLVASLATLTGWAALRLGPVSVPPHVAQWWLPLPVRRRGVLVPACLRAALVATVVCAVATVVVVATTLDVVTTTSVLVALVTGAEVGSVTVSLAGLLQVGGRVPGGLLTATEVLVGAVPAVGAVLLLLAPRTMMGVDDAAWWTDAAWPALTVGAVVCAGLLALWASRLGRVGAATLTSASASVGHASGATLSLDTRELGRAMSRERSGSRRSATSFSAVRGPRTAVVASEGVDLLRDPGALARTVAAGCAGLVAQQVPVLGGGPGLAVVLVTVGLCAAAVGARGARTAVVVPALDAVLPLGSRATRRARCVVPGLTATLAVSIMLSAHVVGDAAWVLLTGSASVAFGAAAVRGAYRPLPDWSSPLLATPFGAVSSSAVSTLLRGPDLAVLCSLPSAVALVTGAPTWGLVVVQVLLAGGAVVVAGRSAAR